MTNVKKINLQKILIFSIILLILTSCSDYKKVASPYFLENVTKFEGNFSVFISENKLINKTVIDSEACESWQVEIETDTAYRKSLINMIERMFQNVEFTNRELTNQELADAQITAQIVLKNHKAKSNFKVVRNVANYNVTLQTDLNVNNVGNFINNSVTSNKTWDKSLYLNCTANEGAYKSFQGALQGLMLEVHEKIFSSINTLTR